MLAGCGESTNSDPVANRTSEAPPALASKIKGIVDAASKSDSDSGRFSLQADVKLVPSESAPAELKALLGKPISVSVKGALDKDSGEGTANVQFAGQKMDFEVRVPDAKDKVFVKYNNTWFGGPASEFTDSAADDVPTDLQSPEVQKAMMQAQALLSDKGATVVNGETVMRGGEKQWRWTVKGTSETWKKLMTESTDDPLPADEAEKIAPILAEKVSATLAVSSEDLSVREVTASIDEIDVATLSDDPEDVKAIKGFGGSVSLIVTDVDEDIPDTSAPDGEVQSLDKLGEALSSQLQGVLMGAMSGMRSMGAAMSPKPA